MNENSTKRFNQRALHRAWGLLLIPFAMVAGRLCGQGAQAYPKPQPDKFSYAADPGNVPDAIAKVRTGNFLGVHVEMIARAHAVEAIPDLEGQFRITQDVLEKDHIASALVRLGEKNELYWNFLVKSADSALGADVPDLFTYDGQGRPLSDNSQEFAAWANAQNISPADAEQQALKLIGSVTYLAITGDPRSIPVLRRALHSRNFMIQSQAALGLAKIRDSESIPFIIEACERAPAEPAAEIASSLVYFDNSQAQSAVDAFVPSDRAKIYRAARSKGKKPFD